MSSSSSGPLYLPYMALGLVCDGSTSGCRPCAHQLGLSTFLTTPVDSGRVLHLYDTDLQLKGVSKPVPHSWLPRDVPITFSHIAAHLNTTLATIGRHIVAFYRLTPVCVWTRHDADIVATAIVSNCLITADAEGTVITWRLPDSAKDRPSKEPPVAARTLLPPDFRPAAIAHPHTYVNKVLLAATDGRTLLLNVVSGKVIHVFRPFDSAITALTPSPVVDVVAVGTASGALHLHNFRTDETVFTFRHAGTDELSTTSVKCAVQAVAFRMDGTETVVTADAAGNLFVWDLNERKLISQASNVHRNGILFAHFLSGEPLLVTTGALDNSVKIHIFDDDVNATVRVLRSRDGHFLPPTKVRFCGQDGLTMVSSGLDRELRLVCAVKEARNRPFSQKLHDGRGKTAKKTQRKRDLLQPGDSAMQSHRNLPPVVDIATKDTRDKDTDFANIVTVHQGLGEAYSWRVMTGASHKHVLKPPARPANIELAFKRNRLQNTNVPPAKKKKRLQRKHDERSNAVFGDKLEANCVTMSPCGNYAYVGFNDGTLHCFNLQSGLHQGVYDTERDGDKTTSPENEWGVAHYGGVRNVCMDGCGETMASTGSSDHHIKFWDVLSRCPKEGDAIVTTPGTVSKAVWCETSDLLAVTLDDFSVRVYDVPTRKLARSFTGHSAPVTDLCFDHNGRRLISSSMDGSIRTWDLPAGTLYNVLSCTEPPTSIALSGNGEFLCSTHSNSLSVRLWVNGERFGADKQDLQQWVRDSNYSALLDDGSDSDSESDSDRETGVDAESSENEIDVTDTVGHGSSQVPLTESILTLSGRPASTWTVLSHYAEVQERNRPREVVKKGENAPFFLPTVKGLNFALDTTTTTTDTDTDIDNQQQQQQQQVNENEASFELSDFGKMVRSADWQGAQKMLSEASPGTVDAEIRSMSEDETIMKAANFFASALRNPHAFEVTQAHLHVFLSAHGTALARMHKGREAIEQLLQQQAATWNRLRTALTSVTSLSAFLSGQV